MTTKQVLRAAGRGLGYVGAGALCVPLGTFQWFMQAGSYLVIAEFPLFNCSNNDLELSIIAY